ncbi:two-component system, OmpR family, sensor kinase [Sphingobium sp. AP50]|uniref:HAMP domain-containing sensor histidine kinase n=1 Tax=Sphingobium sp. AP50 TaxID=1884369 RepID=UPI0008C89962|nr:HAMP domain-containing sensor histidine kinase [Sphingobium sp. AP50]SEK06565.1 two-component system, OmpR family, sensor kinase [Sphingobium sp. AP50]
MTRRLFWKIFWAFWLTFLLQLALMVAVYTFVISPGPGFSSLVVERAGPQTVALASRLLALGGPKAVPAELAYGAVPIVIGRTRPSETTNLIYSERAPNGTLFYLSYPKPPPPSFFGPMRPEIYGVGLITGLLASGILAYYLARPIRLVKAGLERFSAGDLHTRLGTTIGRRRDEIADLARDFDGMANKIEQLVRARDQLLDDVSHELRSPIARLQLAIALTRQSSSREEDTLQRVEREAARLESMVGELLTLSRLESGAPLIEGYFDLQALLDDVIADVRFEGHPHGIKVHCQFEPVGEDGLELAGDAELMRRVFENILRNALRFSPKPGVISVRLTITQVTAVIEMVDQGPGMISERLHTLFEPFVKGHDGGGWGLGMAIAKRAVVAHGGTISASNHAAGGLAVCVMLPLNLGLHP